MPEQWTGDLIGQMHTHGVSQTELALELGMTRSYVCLILSGKRSPSGARERLEGALGEIIGRRNARKIK